MRGMLGSCGAEAHRVGPKRCLGVASCRSTRRCDCAVLCVGVETGTIIQNRREKIHQILTPFPVCSGVLGHLAKNSDHEKYQGVTSGIRAPARVRQVAYFNIRGGPILITDSRRFYPSSNALTHPLIELFAVNLRKGKVSGGQNSLSLDIESRQDSRQPPARHA